MHAVQENLNQTWPVLKNVAHKGHAWAILFIFKTVLNTAYSITRIQFNAMDAQ